MRMAASADRTNGGLPPPPEADDAPTEGVTRPPSGLVSAFTFFLMVFLTAGVLPSALDLVDMLEVEVSGGRSRGVGGVLSEWRAETAR